MEEEEDLSPFWVTSTGRHNHHHHHHRRRSSPFFLNSGFLLMLLLATSLVLIFIVVPAIVSFTSSIFRPHLVKKSWDSLNLVLVLFAIICGFLSRNTNNNNNNYEDTPSSNVSSNARSQWYVSGDEYSDQTVYRPFKNSSFNRLRSSSSYPDLRVENQWLAYTYQDERMRFYDDTRLHGYDSLGSGSGRLVVDQAVKSGQERDDEKFDTKSTIVEQVVVKEMVAPPVEADPQPSAPADHAVSRRKPSGSYEDILMKADVEALHTPHTVAPPNTVESGVSSRVPVSTQQAVRRRRTKSESEIFLPPEEMVAPRPAPAEEPLASMRKPARTYGAIPRKPRSEVETLRPPSPPPYVEAPPPSQSERRRRTKRTHETVVDNPRWESQVPEPVVTPPPPHPADRYYENWEENSGKREKKRSGSATKEFLNSLRRRKKKQRQKSIESFESLLVSQPPPSSSSPRFLYPPPSPPPPPPPPPPPFRFHSIFSSKKGKNKKSHSSPPPPPPPPPKKVINIKGSTLPSQPRISDTNINTGGQSPLIPIPPPPPPPPFKVPDWRYTVRGGFIRINSNTTSRSSSPDIEEEDNDDESGAISRRESAPPSPVVEPITPISCPSPDVNTKADNFIAKFRAGLKLEKMNSIKQKRPGRSNLGLGPDQEPSPLSPNVD